MNRDTFKKIAVKIAGKYSKPELQQMLVKRKDQRISTIIVSALNILALSSVSVSDAPETTFEYLRRTIGPGTWMNEILVAEVEQTYWEILLERLEKAEGDKNIETNIINSFHARRPRLKRKHEDIEPEGGPFDEFSVADCLADTKGEIPRYIAFLREGAKRQLNSEDDLAVKIFAHAQPGATKCAGNKVPRTFGIKEFYSTNNANIRIFARL